MRRDVTNQWAQSNLTPVINAIEHALFARYPRATYTPGLQISLYKCLPEWVTTSMFAPKAQPKALRQQSAHV